MLELYYFPTATCGYKARLTLAEKGVDFTHRVLDREAGELTTPEYLKLNPNAVVPTMVHDGEVLIESSIIMVYTDEAFDGPPLRPEDALGRARTAAWLKMVDEYLPSVGATTYGTFNRKNILKKSPEELEAYYNAIPSPERRSVRRSWVEEGVEAPTVRTGIRTLDRMLGDLETTLSDTGYVTGSDYGLADTAVTPFVSRLNELALSWMWKDRPRVAAWWDRIRERGSFDTVFGAFPNPERAAGMRAAGEEAREAIEKILSAE